jgi:hypothetical protein
MPTKVIRVFPETALERVLEALERELIEASDADILEAAHDLGMKPEMKGSAAFLGLRYPVGHRPEDYFDREWMLQVLNDPRRIWLASGALPPRAQPSATPARTPARTRPGARKPSRSPKEPTEG